MAMNPRRAAGLALALVAAIVIGGATPASAHPLGNFTTNVYDGLRIAPDAVTIDHVVDLAEVPTFRILDDLDRDGDDAISADELDAYATRLCERQTDSLAVEVDGTAVALDVQSSSGALTDGQAGLQTLRIDCTLTAPLPALGPMTFTDRTFPGRLGWREITVAGDETTIADSNVPADSSSQQLRAYPDDRLQSPPDQRTATFSVREGGDALATPTTRLVEDVPGLDWATETFTGLIDDRDLTIGFGLFAIAVAVALGSLHAVAPGHGKTVMAAYIVGQHGTLTQALGLGATVALTHTAGVLVLGVTLSTTATFTSEALYPWLGAASGLLVAAIGAALLIRAVRGGGATPFAHTHGHGPGQHVHHHLDRLLADAPFPSAVGAPALAATATVVETRSVDVRPDVDAHVHHHDHDHQYGHRHDHHDHDHDHQYGHHHPHHVRPANRPLGRRGIAVMGIAGGLVPSPSALIVLLGAIAIGRAWFGVVVIGAYGIGMALTLIAAGVAIARLRDRIARLATTDRPALTFIFTALPYGTAVLVLCGGLLLTARAIGASA